MVRRRQARFFGYDESMEKYLIATGRADVARMANKVKEHLTADKEVYANPSKYFDQIVEIDLNTLEPHLNGPFTPDLATPISKMKEEAAKNGWPTKVEVGLIGSCTNSSYEDISRAASLAVQVANKGLKTKAEFTITPGSEQVRYTIERSGRGVPAGSSPWPARRCRHVTHVGQPAPG